MNRILSGSLLALAALGAAFAAYADAARNVRGGMEIASTGGPPADDDPAVVVRWGDFLVTQGRVTRASAPGLMRAAEQVLAQDPISPGALILLHVGNEALGKPRDASALVLAERLSRREAGAEMLLAQSSFQAGDVRGVVRHFDHLVTVNPDVLDSIVPTIVPLLGDSRYREQFGHYTGRAWFPPFLEGALNRGIPARIMATLVTQSLPAKQAEALNGSLIRHAVLEKDPGTAVAAAARIMGTDATRLAEMGFSPATTDTRIAPIGWRLVVDDHGAARLGAAGALAISVEPDTGAAVAQRVTFLPPGGYVLQSRLAYAADQPHARVSWYVACGGPGGPAMLSAAMPDAPRSITVETRLTVPQGCASQFWELGARGDTDQRASQVTISNVELLVE
ncbi:MAG: hypothetical protein KGN34_02695 [Sphingomonadales bacterium]|nr:hypothetical protein [Sphingomonadales bacterium]